MSSGTPKHSAPILTPPTGKPERWECARHGWQDSILRPSPSFLGRSERWVKVCLQCKADGHAQRTAEAARDAARARVRRMHAIGVMESYRNLDALSYDMDAMEAIDAARATLKAGGGGLFLYGEPGRGKSATLQAMAVAAVEGGMTSRYFQARGLLATLKASFDGGEDPLPDIIGVDVLVIDNMDGTYLSPWGRSVFAELILARYETRANQVTAFGATVSPEAVAEALDVPAVGSRWDNWGSVVEIRGPSRRARK